MLIVNKKLSIYLIYCLLPFVMFKNVAADTEQYRLKALTNLEALSENAKNKNLPLLLIFTTHDCPFCERVKDDYIRPMLISGEYKNKVIIREVPLNSYNYYQTKTQDKVPAKQLARHFKVPFYPVIIFTDSEYCELSERIIGFNTPSLYGGRIDLAIDESISKLNTNQNRFCGIN